MIAVAVLSGAAHPQTYATGDDREKRSAAVLQELVPSPDGPGCAAAVGERGSVVREAGRGKADLKTGRAITPKTVFDMASNSKQFTADAVLLPAGRHRLALDDPLSAYLDDPPAWTRDVTLGDLMRHTSGITDYQDLLEAKGIEVTDPAGQKEAIAAILASRPEEPPGKRFSYSNSNYVLLAHVVERVTGTPFPTFLQQEFFTPLHLRMTLSPARRSRTTRRTAPSGPTPPPGSSTGTAPSRPPPESSSAGPTTTAPVASAERHCSPESPRGR
nr:serine hydrolase domain-containing protein [Streptomyces sp. SID1046]